MTKFIDGPVFQPLELDINLNINTLQFGWRTGAPPHWNLNNRSHQVEGNDKLSIIFVFNCAEITTIFYAQWCSGKYARVLSNFPRTSNGMVPSSVNQKCFPLVSVGMHDYTVLLHSHTFQIRCLIKPCLRFIHRNSLFHESTSIGPRTSFMGSVRIVVRQKPFNGFGFVSTIASVGYTLTK